MSAIERAYLAGFAQAAKEIRNGYRRPSLYTVQIGVHSYSPGFRKGYFAGWDVAK